MSETNLDEVLNNSDSIIKFIRHLISALILSSKTSSSSSNLLLIKNSSTNSNNNNNNNNNQLTNIKSPIRSYPYISSSSSPSCPSDEYGEWLIGGALMQNICDIITTSSGVDLPDDLYDETNQALYDHIVDVVDKFLENADLNKFLENSLAKSTNQEIIPNTNILTKLIKLKNIVQFSLAVDHDRIIRSIEGISIIKPQTNLLFGEINNLSTKIIFSSHPYLNELTNLKYPASQCNIDLSLYQDLNPCFDITYEYINTKENLVTMIKILEENVSNGKIQEISITLHNHAYRSYQGFSCIMLLSTRYKHYIIDTISLRHLINSQLGPIMINSNIVKVFHDSEQTLLWLQRDFNIYVINCFDISEGSKLLKYPSSLMSHLLKYYCGLTLNTRHKLFDWRQRPLTEDMKLFCKYDTNYLLYIYDCIRRDIWIGYGKEGLDAVLNSSRKLCLKKYEKEIFWPLGYRKLLDIPRKSAPKSQQVSPLQDSILAVLWKWRDNYARELDENVTYIMSNSELLRIGFNMPDNIAELEVCSPLSLLVRENSKLILELVFKAKSTYIAINSNNSITKSDNSFSNNEPFDGNSSYRSSPSEDNINNMNKIEHNMEPILAGRALRTPSKEVIDISNNNYNITPINDNSILSPKFSNNMISAPSPVMQADDIFKLAGWSSPLPTDIDLHRIIIDSPSFEEFTTVMQNQSIINDQLENTIISLSTSEMKVNSSVNTTSPSNSISNGSDYMYSSDINRNSIKLNSTNTGIIQSNLFGTKSINSDDENEIIQSNQYIPQVTIPSSLEEIYEISNTNRRRNKDKKKQKDGEDDDDEELNEIVDDKIKASANSMHKVKKETKLKSLSRGKIDYGAPIFDENYYFDSGNHFVENNSIDNTLDFCQDMLCWISDNNEKKILKDSFELDHLDSTND